MDTSVSISEVIVARFVRWRVIIFTKSILHHSSFSEGARHTHPPPSPRCSPDLQPRPSSSACSRSASPRPGHPAAGSRALRTVMAVDDEF